MAVTTTDEAARLGRQATEIRRKVLAMAQGRGQGYVGQGLGAADILTVVYLHELDFDPAEPTAPDRDRFVLSTGHYSIVLFAALAQVGVLDEQELSTYGDDGSRLEMSSLDTTPGVEITGGSLGHGLGVAAGMALGGRLSGRAFTVYNLLSDGELQEGSTWEAAMFAGDRQLGNLTAIVDVNRTQADGDLVVEVEPVVDKFRSFGWWAVDVDGNDIPSLLDAFAGAAGAPGSADRPKAIVCHTRLGSGVPLIMHRERAHFVRVGDDEWALAARQLEEQ